MSGLISRAAGELQRTCRATEQGILEAQDCNCCVRLGVSLLVNAGLPGLRQKGRGVSEHGKAVRDEARREECRERGNAQDGSGPERENRTRSPVWEMTARKGC